jgi:hypothetical protein
MLMYYNVYSACWGGSVNFNVLQCVLWVHNSINVSLHHRVHTEWQWPLFGVHSIMMEKSAQPGARPPPFTISTITYKIVVHAPAKRADTLPIFLLYPYMCDLRKPRRP